MARLKCALPALVCALSFAFTACGGKSPGAGKAPGGPRDAHIEKFKLGHAFGRDGQATEEGRTFAKGDRVYVSFAIVDAQSKAQARVLWVTKPAGTKVAEETKPLPDGETPVSFATDTTSWEPGTYMVEISVVESGVNGVRKLGSSDFSVANSRTK